MLNGGDSQKLQPTDKQNYVFLWEEQTILFIAEDINFEDMGRCAWAGHRCDGTATGENTPFEPDSPRIGWDFQVNSTVLKRDGT
jgi:hypothetical protein